MVLAAKLDHVDYVDMDVGGPLNVNKLELCGGITIASTAWQHQSPRNTRSSRVKDVQRTTAEAARDATDARNDSFT